jgi:hypothetical protein
MDGVVSVFENRRMVLHTTRSWDFIGLPSAAERNLQYESNIIIRMFDTGSCINRSGRTFYVGSTMNWQY